MRRKLTSRKFWVSVAGALYIILSEGLGLNVPQETYWAVVSIVLIYVLGEGIIDARK